MYLRIGYQKKGWTDGEIGAEWIRHFDEATTEKANGAYRLLLVDGHNSHYTLQFLKYAREHKIIVLCYPAHATHIYQGLDVVIFAVVKRYLNEERDKWMRENAKAIDKTNFLEIYGKAHLRALTPDTIKAAFRKTGVWPFNPDVVPEEAMAPSKETSAEGHLPIVPATPVRVMADLIKKLTISDDIDELDEADLSGTDAEPSTPTIPRRSDKMKAAFESAVHALSQTNLDYLASGEKVLAAAPMPQTQTQPISPARSSRPSYADLLAIEPKTPNEVALLAALRESENREDELKRRVINLQAANILNESYCNKLRFQLAYMEQKKKAPHMKGTFGDGLPKLLTDDEFFEQVVKFTEWQKQEAEKKEARKQSREGLKDAVETWKREEVARKNENEAKRERYREAVRVWEAEKAEAKAKKRKFGVPKPKQEQLAAPVPKPTAAALAAEDSEDEDVGEDEVDEDEDEGGDARELEEDC